MITYIDDIEKINIDELAELLYESLPVRRKDSKTDIKKAYEGTTYALFGFVDNELAGAVRVLSDNIEWTIISEIAVKEKYRYQGIGKGLINKVLEKFKGHEIFTYTYYDSLEFYEALGFKRSKNAFTYGGFNGEYLEEGLDNKEFYLKNGFKYETEFYPFAGIFPVGQKSNKDLSGVTIRYSTEPVKNYVGINNLLIRAFGGHDRNVVSTTKAFDESRYVSYAFDGEKVVGCARAVSDGVLQALILNVAVDPDYQGLHIGGKVVENLCRQMKGQNLFLNTHPGGVGFYNRLPYKRNKTALLYPAHPDMPDDIAKGFVLPKGFKFADE